MPKFVSTSFVQNTGNDNKKLLFDMIATITGILIGECLQSFFYQHRSCGSEKYKASEIHSVSIGGIPSFVYLQLGLHYIPTRMYALPMKMLHHLYEIFLFRIFNR